MGIRRRSALIGAGVIAAALFAVATVVPHAVPRAVAAGCPDVEVIFARGRLEPAGPGQIGNVFANGLRAKTGKNVALI